jgi:hypothetical protein
VDGDDSYAIWLIRNAQILLLTSSALELHYYVFKSWNAKNSMFEMLSVFPAEKWAKIRGDILKHLKAKFLSCICITLSIVHHSNDVEEMLLFLTQKLGSKWFSRALRGGKGNNNYNLEVFLSYF